MEIYKELNEIFIRRLEKEIEILKQREPGNLYEPIVYSLNMGGKRIRPLLLMMACRMFSNDISGSLPAAVAIEIFHNFTLLHDDIMDKSVLRRNKKTVHIEFSENAAILSGDAMSFLATEYLLKSEISNLKEVLGIFTDTSLKVCEGQQYDMDFESYSNVTVDDYINMISLKTAILLANSLKIGAVIGGASKEDTDSLFHFGLNIGIAFQLQDDFLDTFGDTDKFGKNIGGDIVSNKKTFLLISALNKAEANDNSNLDYWINVKEFNREEKIRNVIKIYEDFGIREMTSEKIEDYFQKAKKCLETISVNNEVKKELFEVANILMERQK
ncbi:MAG: polyprenyl synthetase family protein [Prolixibacteraceae bacterium]|nr:polyprenyl synthetase family protein [Prolixibacteraceae bacterium]